MPFFFSYHFIAGLLISFSIVFFIFKLMGGKIYSFAAVFSFIIEVLFRRILMCFSISDISFFPLTISGIRVKTKRSRFQPEATVSIGEIKIMTDCVGTFRRFVGKETPWLQRNPSRVYFVYIQITDFSVMSKNIRFRDFLDPPPGSGSMKSTDKSAQSKTNMARLNITQKLTRMVTVVIKKFSFDFEMPMVSSRVRGGASEMRVSTTSQLPTAQVATTKGMPANMCLQAQLFGYFLEVFDADESAVRMTALGKEYLLSSNYTPPFLPDNTESEAEISMLMTIEKATDSIRAEGFLHGHNKVFLAVKPFLSFFEKYQTAEDDSIEMKLIKNLDTGGKMNYIGGDIEESLIVEFGDFLRCSKNIELRISNVKGGIKKECMPGASDMILSLKKVIVGNVGRIEWLGYPDSFVSKVDCTIVKYIKNSAPFRDHEEFDCTVDAVNFPDVSDEVINTMHGF
jgi:hypothetical protein